MRFSPLNGLKDSFGAGWRLRREVSPASAVTGPERSPNLPVITHWTVENVGHQYLNLWRNGGPEECNGRKPLSPSRQERTRAAISLQRVVYALLRLVQPG